MRALVVYGSRRGGTAGIAAAIAEALTGEGLQVDCLAASQVRDVASYDAFVIGGALYAGRWVREARGFVARHLEALCTRPVWMFSSGPLDATAEEHAIPPTPSVAAMMARVGARGHATFGGRLERTAKGFIASRMAKSRAGDWRNWEAIRLWAHEIARVVARRPHVIPHAPPPRRWLVAALCAVTASTAVLGGAALIARPDGAYLHASTSLLADSPFSTFLIPGLLLVLGVGASSLVGAVRAVQRYPHAGFGAGAVLFCWIVGEMILLRTFHPLQLVYLGIAIAVMTLSVGRTAQDPAA